MWKENFGWINIDSQAPNKVVKEWLEGQNEFIDCPDLIKPEYTYGDSRVDFYLEKDNRRILMEVKGCTLEIDGEGYFPDAPTERGVKHLNELSGAISQGFECYLAFVIAMERAIRRCGQGQKGGSAVWRKLKTLWRHLWKRPDKIMYIDG